MKRLSKLLLNKSQEAFLLSLEIYNKPTIQYRVESFCFFFTNAWELLLKAYILEKTGKESSIFYPKQKGQPKKSIAIRDAIKKIFPRENDPIRKNVEDIADLRDEATHLIIQELESVYVGLFQAGVLNYIDSLREWFGVSIAKKVSPAMLSLIFDVDSVDPILIKKKYGAKAVDFFAEKLSAIENNIDAFKDKKYCISIEYKLALVKNPKNADITLSPSAHANTTGTIIRVPKDPKSTHPYRQKDCIEEIKKAINKKGFIFNNYDFQAIFYKEKMKGDYLYHYRYEPFGYNAYSRKLIDMMIDKIKRNPNYPKIARKWYRDYLQKNRGKKDK
ncbi:MAG: DUF3644 domain-containing protein [Candidatus Omnitrophica bacterium]|nr:DUF3644 domain-containing protein [Candidatus Omnitrophota bacterium]